MSDLMAVDQAITKYLGLYHIGTFLAQDYFLLKDANPTDQKGKTNMMQKNRYLQQARDLFYKTTQTEDQKPKPTPVSKDTMAEIIKQFKQSSQKNKLENVANSEFFKFVIDKSWEVDKDDIN